MSVANHPAIYCSRAAMIGQEVPRKARCCEVGVFMLDFAQQIIGKLSPSRLTLIDSFPANMFSCDEHGGNPRHVSGGEASLRASSLASSNAAVEILHGPSSSLLPTLPDSFYDLIYIDADHSYAGCTSDLEAAWGKVAPGGALAGHDYAINPDKVVDASHYSNFGVRGAVDAFCDRHRVSIAAFGMDGYVSFLIRKPA